MTQIEPKDFGPRPSTFNIEEASIQDSNYRTALWTGKYLQLTLMSIPVGGEIGLEVHPELDQFLRLEDGRGRVQMGDAKDKLSFDKEIEAEWVVLVPAGTWHNITNVGDKPMKIYSIYAPPEHPHGTIHVTKTAADSAEGSDH